MSWNVSSMPPSVNLIVNFPSNHDLCLVLFRHRISFLISLSSRLSINLLVFSCFWPSQFLLRDSLGPVRIPPSPPLTRWQIGFKGWFLYAVCNMFQFFDLLAACRNQLILYLYIPFIYPIQCRRYIRNAPMCKQAASALAHRNSNFLPFFLSWSQESPTSPPTD